jgi:predicted ATPase
MYQFLRDVRASRESAEYVIELSAEHGLPDYAAFMNVQLGWAIALNGQHEDGIAKVKQGLMASEERGALLMSPYFLCLLAEALGEADRTEEALSALAEAIDLANEQDNRSLEPEIHRLTGEMLLRRNGSDVSAAQDCFQRAIDCARVQNARLPELRAMTSIARLLASQGRRDEARVMLAEIYNWFTEGFDTADLKDAKALLDELGH